MTEVEPDQIRRIQRKRRNPPGALPGTLTADPAAPKPVIEVIAYGPDRVEERKVADPAELRGLAGKLPVTWINVDGLGDAEVVRRIGEIFQLHPLAQEDIINAHQRAKLEPYGEHLFIVSRMFSLRERRIESEQLSIYLGRDFVLTFQEIPGDCLDPVRARIRQGRGAIRGRGTDHLAYALLDAVIDGYFPILEKRGESLENLETLVLERPQPGSVRQIHLIKRDLLLLRRGIWPLREAVNSLHRDPLPLISDETRLFLRDCYDHCVQIIDLIETYRELGADLTDVYLSSVSFRTNEVMRLLTVIATIFIPLTFLVGLWGMNFDPSVSRLNMPELRWRYGYPFALSVMVVVAVALLAYFRLRGWLGAPPEPGRKGRRGPSGTRGPSETRGPSATQAPSGTGGAAGARDPAGTRPSS